MNTTIEILTNKLNSLRIKKAMWIEADCEYPEYLDKEIQMITEALNKGIVEKDVDETTALTTKQKN
jgi:hypothetical protein